MKKYFTNINLLNTSIFLSLAILNSVIAWLLNISVSFYGKPTFLTLIVTLIYIAVWVFIYLYILKTKKKLLLYIFLSKWIIQTIMFIIGLIIAEFDIPIFIFESLLLIAVIYTTPQFNGLIFLTGQGILFVYTVMIISLVFSILFLLQLLKK